MQTAQITSWGSAPKYSETETSPTPDPSADTVQVRVAAVGVHQLVRSRDAGQHYTTAALPHTPGADGTGTTADGKEVYFSTLQSGTGSFAEFVNVPRAFVTPLPEGMDKVQAAATVNPGLSSWMALRYRVDTKALPPHFTVLIHGATTASGILAATIARSMGAGKVIGVARNQSKMDALGFDATIKLEDDIEKTDYSTLGEIDIILDYLYGPPLLHLLKGIESSRPVQYVQIGSLAGLEISLPSGALRSKDITMRGAGPGAWSMEDLAKEMPALLEVLVKAKPIDVRLESLADIESAWEKRDDGARLVFVI